MIPIVLVTGFLGSGKTTFLRRVAAAPQGRQVVFLVNEFADLNIDAQRVRGLGIDVFEVSGGSLFCECKVRDFISNLDRISRHYLGSGGTLRGVVIETSGIADPEVMAKLLVDTGFSERFVLSRVLALVAPYRFEDFLRAYPNLGSQVRTADCVLLNKTDLATPEELDAVERRISALKPEVVILRTRFAEADVSLWDPLPVMREETGRLSGRSNPYASLTLVPPADGGVSALRALCERHAARLLRVKGIVVEAGRAIEVDFSSGQFAAVELDRPAAAPQLVIVVDERDEAWARSLFEQTL